MSRRPETRWGAFGIHLAISAVIFLALAALIVIAWYPGFLFRTDGGWQGIRLIAGIDLVLGPLLTLIVYDRAKKSLPFDLAVIGFVQASALAIGCWLVYNERPIAVVFADNKFSTLSKNSFAFNGIDPSTIDLIRSGDKPVWIFAPKAPPMPGETELENFNRLGPAHLRVENYLPLQDHFAELAPAGTLQIEGDIAYQPDEQRRYYRMISRYYEGYLVFDLERRRVDRLVLTNSTESYGVTATGKN